MSKDTDEKSEGAIDMEPLSISTIKKQSVELIIDDFKKFKEQIHSLEDKLTSTSCDSDP